MSEGNKLNFNEKLLRVQAELKAPKDKSNKFGGYKYRSAESILEAVKPLLDKYQLTMKINDEIVMVGERYYVKATVSVVDAVSGVGLAEVSAYAREEEAKKGMDSSQITGAASSYARKYALNGLLLIDDTKDADTEEYAKQTDKSDSKITPKQIEAIRNIAESQGKELDEDALKSWTIEHASEFIKKYGGKK